MALNKVGREIPDAYAEQFGAFGSEFENVKPYAAAVHTVHPRTPGESKLLDSIHDAIVKTGITDGMTISFHHHFREGDYVMNMVLDEIARMGIKDISIAPSSIANVHEPLIEHIKNGVVTHITSSGLRDKLGAAISAGIMDEPVIIRNLSAGSFAKRYGVEEGIVFDEPTIEFSYKNDDLGDPLLNTYHALALKLATQQEIDLIQKYAFMVNDLLKGFMKEIGIDLVDFKLEFGKTSDGAIVLADEISPDTCRLWDETTHEKLDKDRFRRDLGGAEEAYEEVMRRLMGDR